MRTILQRWDNSIKTLKNYEYEKITSVTSLLIAQCIIAILAIAYRHQNKVILNNRKKVNEL